MEICFSPFRLDVSSEQLWRADEPLALRPKTFAVLRYLVEHAGQLVTKDILLDAVWAGTIVSDTVLKSCIRELREALGDDAQTPHYIATAHRRGYRFVGQLSDLPSQPAAPAETKRRREEGVKEVERKLAAILSADVQGYSRLMGKDEVRTIRTLTTYRAVMTALIGQHRGRVVDAPGDNVLAEFASAVDAVQCAIAIQDALGAENAALSSEQKMAFRIGLNVGDVVVADQKLYGDGVNIAARLEQLAEAGGLCISGTVYDQIKNKVALKYEYLGERVVKNIVEPVRVYRVKWESEGHPVSPATSPAQRGPSVSSSEFQVSSSRPEPTPSTQHSAPTLVGRDAELSHLHRWLDKALAGERQLVFVTGEAGIGKTTLIEVFVSGVRSPRSEVEGKEARQKAKGKNQKAKVEDQFPDPKSQIRNPVPWIAWGQCIEQYGAGEAYMPILEALGRLCREPGGERLVPLLNHHAPTWLVQMPTLLNAAELEVLQSKVQGATRERMLREMAEAVDALTAERPLVLWLEDLHWSDVSTLELLALLARRREPARLLVLGTYRPVDVIVKDHPLRAMKQELQLHGQCQELAVRLLSEEHIAEYLTIRSQVPSPAPAGEGQGEGQSSGALADLAHTIHQRTEGNPLFMVNVVDEILAQGQLDRAEVEIPTPATIRQMIERQLERLSTEEQRMLEVASIAGMEFSSAAVAAGTDTAIEAVEEPCAELARRGQFLQTKGTADWPDGTIATHYGFLHALYQEVIYERVPMGRRTILHQRVGERIEIAYGERTKEVATELAVHFERGRDYQRAVRYLQQAGELASKRLALREAIAHLNQGLKIVGLLRQSPERNGRELDLRIPLGIAWMALKGWTAPEVWTSLHPALGLAKSLRHRTALLPIYYGLWNNIVSQGRIAESLDWVHDMLATAEAGGDEEFLIVAHRAACDTYFWRGDFIQSRVHGEQALVLYDEEQHRSVADLLHSDPKTEVGTWLSFGSWMLGYPDRAVQESEATITHARRRGHAFDLGWALTCSSLVWAHRGAPEQILARTEETERLGRAHDLPFLDVLAQLWKGMAWLQAGYFTEGIPQLQRVLETLNAHSVTIQRPHILAVLAEGLALSGDVTGGLRMIEESLTQIARPGWEERWALAEILRLKGWMLALQGDLVGAEQQYLASLDWAREQQAKSWELRTATSLARLWQQQALGQSAKSKEVRAKNRKRESHNTQHESRNRLAEAHKLLSEIYGWFTEGFDTKDLQEAQALLEELS